MRPLLLSLATCLLLLGAAWAQNAGEGSGMPQLPVGQTFVRVEFPYYPQGKLKATLYADEATGITLNRAETKGLKITVYDNGAVTTTVTSPQADLYVNEQKMRTSHTVKITRSDMEATSQDCDFDLKTKKYVLRTQVKVVLKHFNLSMSPGTGDKAASAPMPAVAPVPAAVPPPHPATSNNNSGSLLDLPGGYAETNAAPTSSPTSK